MNNLRIAFIGAGNMAASLIGGLRAQGLDASRLCAADPNEANRARMVAEHGIDAFADNTEALANASVVVLAVKPQIMKAVCQDLASHLRADQLIVSVAAGITCESLRAWLGGNPAIVRCMPNTPALLRAGASGLYANAQVSAEQRAQAEALLEAVGLVLWLEDERQLDAVTAVSGSGPAYFFLLVEAMTAAGERLGLAHEVAARLAGQTALGAARMLTEGDVDAAELRRRVCSPNGTTEAAVKAFQDGGFEPLVQQALDAAAHRSAELAAQLGQ